MTNKALQAANVKVFAATLGRRPLSIIPLLAFDAAAEAQVVKHTQ